MKALIPQIKQLSSQGLNGPEIARRLNRSPSYIRTLANRNGINLRVPAETYIGNQCKCGSSVRYISCGACVDCKKKLNKKRYHSSVNEWISKPWRPEEAA